MTGTQKEKAKRILEENLYMVIATSTPEGTPWISPVYFAHDQNFHFYFASARDSNHSHLIEANNKVAVVVFDSSLPEGTGDGVYFTGKALEVQGEELNQAIEILYGKKERLNPGYKRIRREAADFEKESPWGMYKIIPERFWTLKEPVEIQGFPSNLKEEIIFP